MSIDKKLKEAVDAGRLVAFEGEFHSDPEKRLLLLHPQLVKDMQEIAEEDRRVGRLQADFEMFAKGEFISMSLTPYKHETAYMGLLSPESEGTHEIRSRDPNPGIRVFGKFPCENRFVALHWAPRSKGMAGRNALGHRHSIEYQFAQIETNQRWEAALPDVVPAIGDKASDFLTFKASLVSDRK